MDAATEQKEGWGKMKWQGKIKVKYRSLSKGQKRQLTNGCGALNSRFKPPHNKLFTPACGPHDYKYYCGGLWWHKVKADWDLRRDCRAVVEGTDIETLRNNLYFNDKIFSNWTIRQIYYRWADAYAIGVLFGGNSSFRFDWCGPQWPVMEGWGL